MAWRPEADPERPGSVSDRIALFDIIKKFAIHWVQDNLSDSEHMMGVTAARASAMLRT